MKNDCKASAAKESSNKMREHLIVVVHEISRYQNVIESDLGTAP